MIQAYIDITLAVSVIKRLHKNENALHLVVKLQKEKINMNSQFNKVSLLYDKAYALASSHGDKWG